MDSRNASRMTRRTLMRGIGLGLAAAAVAACAPASPTAVSSPTSQKAAEERVATTAPATEAASGPVKLTAAAWAIAGYSELQGESFGKYATEHPDVEIEWLQMPSSDYYTKMSVLFAANTGPEISLYTPERYLDYAARGTFRSIDALVDRDSFDLSDFYPILMEMCTWRSKVGGLPAYCSPIVCYHNKTLLEGAGADLPSEAWTWEDLRQSAIKATDASNGVFGFGLEREMWACIMWSNGGDVWNPDLTESTFDDEIVVDALQWWADLRLVDNCAPSVAQMSDMKTEMLFQTGKLAMVYHPLSRSIPIVDAGVPFEWALGWAPQGSEGRSLRLGAGVWALGKDCKPEALDVAWDALMFITGPEEQKVWAGKHINVPARKSVAESAVFMESAPPDGLEVNIEMMPYQRSPHKLPGYMQWWDKTIKDGTQLIELGTKRAAEACLEVKQQMDQWLKDNPQDEWVDLL